MSFFLPYYLYISSLLSSYESTLDINQHHLLNTSAYETIIDYQVGDVTVQAAVYQKGTYAKELYFNMHDDENTSVEAAKKVIDLYGGRLVELRHNGQREVTFNLKGKQYKFDPNRIFTRAGVKATLTRYGKHSKAAEDEVYEFGQKLIKDVVADAEIVVAMHNNVNTIYFSVASYAPGGGMAKEAANIYINPQMGTGDFFFVTDIDFFNHFKDASFSVVLQNNNNMTDDGSLSVYCGMKKIPYINVEAQRGHLQEQIAMLKELQNLLPSYQSYLAIQAELERQREMQRKLEEQQEYQEFKNHIETQMLLHQEILTKLENHQNEKIEKKSKEQYDEIYENFKKTEVEIHSLPQPEEE